MLAAAMEVAMSSLPFEFVLSRIDDFVIAAIVQVG